jgi:hypothetical protein
VRRRGACDQQVPILDHCGPEPLLQDFQNFRFQGAPMGTSKSTQRYWLGAVANMDGGHESLHDPVLGCLELMQAK